MPVQKPGRSKQDYATPACLITAVLGLLGVKEFAHDFAADESNAKAQTYWGVESDAFSFSGQEWALMCGQGWGWLNPPFNKIGPWAKRCMETQCAGGNIALLVPAAVGSNWFRNYVHTRALVFALNGRVPFMPDHPTWLYPKDAMLCLFNSDCVAGFDVWTWR